MRVRRETQEYQWDIPDYFRMDEVRSGHSWKRRKEERAKVGVVPTFAVYGGYDYDHDGTPCQPFGVPCAIILMWTRADQIGPVDGKGE